MSSASDGAVDSSKTRGRKRGRRRVADPDEELSRSLSWALRHAAPSLGLPMGADGYVPVDAVLSCSHPRFAHKSYTLGDVRRVVERNDKRRFRLERRRRRPPQQRTEGGGTIDDGVGGTVDCEGGDREADEGEDDDSSEWFIRANQGHSISAVMEENLLTPISPRELRAMDTIVHGTTRSAWERHIRHEGLSRMRRNHIHFASSGLVPAAEAVSSMHRTEDGLTKDAGHEVTTNKRERVISGMRASSQIHIFVDGGRCAEDSVQFFRSDNGVILSAGLNNEGMLPMGYISRVVDAERKEVLFENGSPASNQVDGS